MPQVNHAADSPLRALARVTDRNSRLWRSDRERVEVVWRWYGDLSGGAHGGVLQRVARLPLGVVPAAARARLGSLVPGVSSDPGAQKQGLIPVRLPQPDQLIGDFDRAGGAERSRLVIPERVLAVRQRCTRNPRQSRPPGAFGSVKTTTS